MTGHKDIRPSTVPSWRSVGLWIFVVLVALAIGYLVGRSGALDQNHGGANGSTIASTTGAAKQLWTCSMHPQVIQDKPGICPICHMELTPLKASGASSDGSGSHVLTIDPAVVQNMGVRVADVRKGALVQSVRAVGYLEEPEFLHFDVNLRVNGWIEKLYANVDGMMITKGKPLFDLYSPELTVAIDELISANKGNSAGGSETGRALLDASRRKLVQFGLTEKQVDEFARLDAAPPTVPILAPMDGHLTSKMVYEGAAVKAGDLVLRLASRHRIWIDAQVYEQQMPLISDGQPARATLVAEPGKTYEGRVLFVHPHVDPKTRTALVRIEIPNDDLKLRQGMYASVEILADKYEEATVVPREAVIDTGKRQIAFVALGDGRFEPRTLTLGLPGQDGTVQVLSGVAAGERIVTSGQFLLDSESRLREAIAKFGANPSPHAGHGATAAQPATPLPQPASTNAVPAHDHSTGTKLSVPHLDDVLNEYLVLAGKLGERQSSTDAVNAAALHDIATTAAGHASGEAKALLTPIADTSAALKGKSLDEQRKAFVPLSEAVVALVRRAKPSPAVAPTLFVMNCPMAFGLDTAHWLQKDEIVANPFYAVEMKQCGSVVERIDLQNK